ncbi:hypothetical protein QYE76_057204 [Lolium multiflorum]|uniref:Reverse transcriptase Ty1/copia-type domain-containing protein n=1 Tax=Lolium multiflorum TaxID=4521 RepID=A0AAD8T4L1_LOLMU|nr:hypothetical protein QYE76_057204 [Lolium multiflorum]
MSLEASVITLEDSNNHEEEIATLESTKAKLLSLNSMQEESLVECLRMSKEKVTCCDHEEVIASLKRSEAKLMEVNSMQEEALKEYFPLSKDRACCNHESDIAKMESDKRLLMKMNSLQEEALMEHFRVNKAKEVQEGWVLAFADLKRYLLRVPGKDQVPPKWSHLLHKAKLLPLIIQVQANLYNNLKFNINNNNNQVQAHPNKLKNNINNYRKLIYPNNRHQVTKVKLQGLQQMARFEMSMMGELKYFLGFEIKQMRQGTFINQAKYLQDMLKRFDMKEAKGHWNPMHLKSSPKESHIVAVKRIFRYLVDTPHFGLWYPRDTDFALVGFTDSDWAGDKVDRKSTSGACHFLGRSLVCWSSKKQNCVSVSTAEAEYVAAASSCAQILWMRRTLRDYGLEYSKVPLLCDNESAIKIAYNPVLHGKTKHIEIRNHFIRDHIARGDIVLSFIGTKEQLADIFTKPLDEKRFIELRHELNIIDPSNFA